MNCQTGSFSLWVAAAGLLVVIVIFAAVFFYRKLKAFKMFLMSLRTAVRETAAAAAQTKAEVTEIIRTAEEASAASKKATAASEKAIALSGKIRTEMTAYHTAVMCALEKKKKNWDDFPETIMDKVMPLKNNDGTVYGFKIQLADGSSFIAVIHTLQKDDLPEEKNQDFSHSSWTLMRYDAGGELMDVRTDPIDQPREK